MSEVYELYASKTFTSPELKAVTADLATFEDGRSLVAWDADGTAYFQVYDRFGEPDGKVVTIQQTGAEAPKIAVLTDGTFVIAYTNYTGDLTNLSTIKSSLGVKHFDTDGNLLSATASLGGMSSSILAISPLVAATDDGGFVAIGEVVDQSTGFFNVISGSFEPTPQNTWSGTFSDVDTGFYDIATDLKVLPDGGYAVARSVLSFFSGTKNYLEVIDAGSGVDTHEFPISTSTSTTQTQTSMAVGLDGSILFTWKSDYAFSGSDIDGRLINPYTGEATSNFSISIDNSVDVSRPSIELTADGTFLVTWSEGRGGEIYAREISATGELLGTEMHVTDGKAQENAVEYTYSELNPYLDQGMAMVWQSDTGASDGVDAHVGWFGYFPDLTLLSDGNDTAEGTNSADLIDLGAGKDHYMAEAGYDIVKGGNGADYIHGGNGWDRLFGESGTDELQGGRGNDELNGGGKSDYLNGGQGNDRLYGNQGDDELWGKNGKDFLFGGTGNDLLYGNSGNDEMGGGSGNDTLNGGHGQDQMFGHSGNDVLSASNGADVLDGGANDDILTGGSGKDTFKFGLGNDRITDFDAETDKLLLDSDLLGGSTNVQSFVNRASIAGDDIVFDFDSENTLTLLDFTDMTSLADRIEIF